MKNTPNLSQMMTQRCHILRWLRQCEINVITAELKKVMKSCSWSRRGETARCCRL